MVSGAGIFYIKHGSCSFAVLFDTKTDDPYTGLIDALFFHPGSVGFNRNGFCLLPLLPGISSTRDIVYQLWTSSHAGDSYRTAGLWGIRMALVSSGIAENSMAEIIQTGWFTTFQFLEATHRQPLRWREPVLVLHS